MTYWPDLPRKLQSRVAAQLQRDNVLGSFPGVHQAVPMPEASFKELGQALAAASEPLQLEAGDRLVEEGQPAPQLFLMEEGQMELSSAAVQGEARFRAPAWVGLTAIFAAEVPDCGRQLATVEAVSDCRLWAVDAAVVRHHLLVRSPTVLLFMAEMLRRNASSLAGQLQALPAEQQGDQYAGLLATLQRIARGMDGVIEMLESRKEAEEGQRGARQGGGAAAGKATDGTTRHAKVSPVAAGWRPSVISTADSLSSVSVVQRGGEPAASSLLFDIVLGTGAIDG